MVDAKASKAFVHAEHESSSLSSCNFIIWYEVLLLAELRFSPLHLRFAERFGFFGTTMQRTAKWNALPKKHTALPNYSALWCEAVYASPLCGWLRQI